jgi:AraC family transcriptional regulator, regulatory protein of adaptative response / methylated-DNA-[protein]-cysteine methyltransferase
LNEEFEVDIMSAVLEGQLSLLKDDNEALWQAVVEKDRRAEGKFVFAVKTTGVYCRPSCAARRPRRENVRFFQTTEAAEQAGFRACLRCKPKESRLTDPHVELVQRACRLIEEQEDEKLSLEALSKQLGLSSFHLQRTFKQVIGISPRQYAEACRTDRFRTNVRSGDSVTMAMYAAGYGSSSRLYERAGSELGMTPATYGRRGIQTTIHYTVAKSPLGYLLVAATSKGICSVRLGDSVAELDESLRSEYEAAEIRKDDKTLSSAVKQILDHLDSKQPHLDLPLDIRATAFQRQVWEALRSIPYGETRSYGEVARAIGQPKAVRAVARACATNPVALVIPCHRVIREDKSLGGYRWGIDRKKKLLAKESQHRDSQVKSK